MDKKRDFKIDMEDKNYPRYHWQYEVAEGLTSLGYWDWVDYQTDMALFEKKQEVKK